MKELEEVVYEIARDALADQERLVAGIRLRTGTLVAAHALVASFLGTPVLRDTGLSLPAWIALVALTTALALAAVVLAPWKLRFSVAAPRAHRRLSQYEGTGTWLLEAARMYDRERLRNDGVVPRLDTCSGAIAALIVGQTGAWLLAMAVG